VRDRKGFLVVATQDHLTPTVTPHPEQVDLQRKAGAALTMGNIDVFRLTGTQIQHAWGQVRVVAIPTSGMTPYDATAAVADCEWNPQ
jgi:hypothetical protein